jgi:hypothetical protein
MPRPATGRLADDVYEEVSPLAYRDEADGWPLLHFIQAVGATVADIEDVVYDTDDGPGWSAAVDLDRAPARLLSWLAQLNGTVPRTDLTDTAYRTHIREAGAQKRGTPGAMIAAAQAQLTGSKSVRLLERDTSPYHLTVVVRPSEVPRTDRDRTWDEVEGTWDVTEGAWDDLTTIVRDAVLAQKPAGLVLTFLMSDSPLIDEGSRTIDAATATIDSAQLADVT